MVDRIQAVKAEGKAPARPTWPVGPRALTARLFEAFRRTHRDQVELSAPPPEPHRSVLSRFARWAWGGIKHAAHRTLDAAIAAGKAVVAFARRAARKIVEGLAYLWEAFCGFWANLFKRLTGGELHAIYVYFFDIKLRNAKSEAKGRIARADLPHLVGAVDGVRDLASPYGIAASVIKNAEDWKTFHRNHAKAAEAGRQEKSRIERQRESRLGLASRG